MEGLVPDVSEKSPKAPPGLGLPSPAYVGDSSTGFSAASKGVEGGAGAFINSDSPLCTA